MALLALQLADSTGFMVALKALSRACDTTSASTDTLEAMSGCGGQQPANQVGWCVYWGSYMSQSLILARVLSNRG